MATTNLKIENIKSIGNTFATFEIYPFERGYGNTFAAPIRRTLLSSIRGISITSVKVKGLDHEFSTIKGVKEDALRVVMNLSKVIFQSTSIESEKFSLKVHGKKVVVADDIKRPSNITIVNPDTYICELTDDKAQLEIEGVIESGFGFEIADNERRNAEPGLIPLNKNFSPVDKVNANVVSTRVGQRTDMEKIIIDITTNGSISPAQALKEALNKLLGDLTVLNDVIQSYEDVAVEEEPKEDSDE